VKISMMVIQPGFLYMPWLQKSQNYVLRDLNLSYRRRQRLGIYIHETAPAPLVGDAGGTVNLLEMRGGSMNITAAPDDERMITFFPNKVREINELLRQIPDHQHEKL
jgi:hypothetical protein